MMMSRGKMPVGSGQRKPLAVVQTPLGNKTNRMLPPFVSSAASAGAGKNGGLSKRGLDLGDKIDFGSLEKEVMGMNGGEGEEWALDFELGDLDLGRE